MSDPEVEQYKKPDSPPGQGGGKPDKPTDPVEPPIEPVEPPIEPPVEPPTGSDGYPNPGALVEAVLDEMPPS